MKEVKTPKKPLAIYYAIVLLVLMLLNFVLVPWMSERQVKEVDYGTFMSMTEDKDIGRVDVESNQIIFTDKDEKQIYKTGLMNDPDLTQRLYDAGAQFSSEIVEQASPLMSFLLSFVLPIVLFVWLGNFMNKKLIEKAGGANSMMFGGVGKSNAKVYVQSTHGIRFADVAGEDEAKENLQEIVDYLHDPKKYEEIGASMPKGILLVGPPGTGKTMLARYIHSNSRRASAPFVTINCASIPENLIESELFGYVSGAFTGAGQKGKVGLVETANGGTLFLDEIGTLPLNLQSKFLQLVQEKSYLPVGGVKLKTADVRIISATNLDLSKQVEDGVFREDLYYRLRVIEFHMPPLRERTDALDPLIDHFLTYYNQKYQIAKTISIRARETLKRHSWNGNIRELQYVIERIMVTSLDGCIQPEDIPPLQSTASEESERQGEEQSFDQSMEAFERKLLRRAYQKYGSSYKVAAALGISQTKASRLLRKYDIR